MALALGFDNRLAQEKLAEMANARLPRRPHIQQALKLVGTHLESSSLMAALILASEFDGKRSSSITDTLVSAALVAGAGNFDMIADQVSAASSAIAHEFRAIYAEGSLPVHTVQTCAASTKHLFFAGMIADLEASVQNTRAGNGYGLVTLAELIRVASTSGDVDRALLHRTASAFNCLSGKAGHKKFLVLNNKGQIVVEEKMPVAKKWQEKDRHNLDVQRPRPPRFA